MTYIFSSNFNDEMEAVEKNGLSKLGYALLQ